MITRLLDCRFRDFRHRDGLERLVVAIYGASGYGIYDIHAGDDLAENSVVVRKRSVLVHDEELAAIGVWARIGHGDRASDITGLIRRRRGIQFIGELIAWSSPASASRIATLDHEAGDDAVEYRTVIEALVSEREEILDRVRRIGVIGLEYDSAFVRLDGDFMHEIFYW